MICTPGISRYLFLFAVFNRNCDRVRHLQQFSQETFAMNYVALGAVGMALFAIELYFSAGQMQIHRSVSLIDLPMFLSSLSGLAHYSGFINDRGVRRIIYRTALYNVT